MRLMRLCTNYPGYLEHCRERHPERMGLPHAEQLRLHVADCYGWADFWTHHLGELDYEVWEPVGNAREQQLRWAQEHGVRVDESDWLPNISLAQVMHFKPEVLLINDHHTFTRAFIEEVRRACPSVRLVLGWCGAPFGSTEVFTAYDLTLTNVPRIHDYLKDRGFPVRLCRHGFSPLVLERMGTARPGAGFTFIGSVITERKYHETRARILAHLSRDTGLEILSPSRKALRETGIPDSAVRKDVFGLDMYRALAQSAVTLNTHIDIALGHANNMRLFEATGVGTCLLTDWTPELSELFEPGAEVVTYRSPEEAGEKARYLLEHPRECAAIAAAGQRRTLRDHSFSQRAATLDSIISQQLKTMPNKDAS